MERHQQMANNMMKGFGRDVGAVFDRDPFANDPFFKEPFGNIDKVIGAAQQHDEADVRTYGLRYGRRKGLGPICLKANHNYH